MHTNKKHPFQNWTGNGQKTHWMIWIDVIWAWKHLIPSLSWPVESCPVPLDHESCWGPRWDRIFVKIRKPLKITGTDPSVIGRSSWRDHDSNDDGACCSVQIYLHVILFTPLGNEEETTSRTCHHVCSYDASVHQDFSYCGCRYFLVQNNRGNNNSCEMINGEQRLSMLGCRKDKVKVFSRKCINSSQFALITLTQSGLLRWNPDHFQSMVNLIADCSQGWKLSFRPHFPSFSLNIPPQLALSCEHLQFFNPRSPV